MLEETEISQREIEEARFKKLQISILRAVVQKKVLDNNQLYVFLSSEEKAAGLRGHIEDLMDRGLMDDEIIYAGVVYIKMNMLDKSSI
jgi:hypothetical protein